MTTSSRDNIDGNFHSSQQEKLPLSSNEEKTSTQFGGVNTDSTTLANISTESTRLEKSTDSTQIEGINTAATASEEVPTGPEFSVDSVSLENVSKDREEKKELNLERVVPVGDQVGSLIWLTSVLVRSGGFNRHLLSSWNLVQYFFFCSVHSTQHPFQYFEL